ncbi:MAG TPA: M48 family metalloprotease [Edaphocola sp.]|nr:M48 family metalloprotease [Edaphocola sp.]
MKRYLLLSALFVLSAVLPGCDKDTGLNIFTIQDDISLGQQTKAQIEANPSEYPILKESTHQAAYSYIRAIKNDILDGGKLTHKDDFPWQIYIIDRDDVQNAFCTPGGYIYVYTGLIKYLDNKSSLAGVLGHEMAHADKRHTTELLTKEYGIQTLLDVVLGKNQGLLTEIAANLVTLKFTRNEESEADKYSVIYLCPTKYHSDGAADFFQKIIDSGSSTPPEFLSTHPNPDHRIQNIEDEAQSLGCTATISQQEEVNSYAQFKASL